jgi:hypothetical protein
MINIVTLTQFILEPNQMLHTEQNILLCQGAVLYRHIKAELGINFVPSDNRKIIGRRIIKQLIKKFLRNLNRRRTGWPEPPINFDQGLLLIFDLINSQCFPESL